MAEPLEPIDLFERFPEMRPIKSAPSMFTLNGVGTGLYGRRDVDPGTGTYVKTLSICILFVPLIPVAAYRVSDARRGWIFHGRVPLSGLARRWNWMLVLLVVATAGMVILSAYESSPEYRAGQWLEEMEAAEARGDVAGALGLADQVATRGGERRPEGVQAMVRMMTAAAGGSDLESLAELARASRRLSPACRSAAARTLTLRLLELAEAGVEATPATVLRALEVATALRADAGRVASIRERALLELVESGQAGRAQLDELALTLETRGEDERLIELLSPRRETLGDGEAARILGELLAARGELEAANELLAAYVRRRLEELHQAEADYEREIELAYDRAIKALRAGAAGQAWYARYDGLTRSADRQQAMVDEFCAGYASRDPGMKRRLARLQEAARVVPVALDLGMVLLQSAQDLEEGEARRARLEEAEAVFLAVQTVADESEQYRLYLAQVKYWLGKSGEGKALMDELLADPGISFAARMSAADTLREVGEVDRALELVEAAYESEEATEEERQAAAQMRAMMTADGEESVTWLERADPESIDVQVALAAARGARALASYDDAIARRELSRALEGYRKLPQTASTQNNGALVAFDLYQVSGEPGMLQEGITLMQSALDQDPANSILVANLASRRRIAGLHATLGGRYSPAVLRLQSDETLLTSLYEDEAGLQATRDRYAAQPDVMACRELCNRFMLLAPRSTDGPAILLEMMDVMEDAEGLKALLARLEQAPLDLETGITATLMAYAGGGFEETAKALDAQLEWVERQLVAARERKAGDDVVALAHHLAVMLMTRDLVADGDSGARVLELAEEVGSLSSSRLAQRLLRYALIHRVDGTLARRAPVYASMRERTSISLNASARLAVAMMRDEGLRELALEDPDLRRAAEIMAAMARDFHRDRHTISWAILQYTAPELAADIARELARDGRPDELARRCELALMPVRVSAGVELHLLALARGDEEGAAQILEHMAELGARLP